MAGGANETHVSPGAWPEIWHGTFFKGQARLLGDVHTAQANCAPFLTEIVRGDMGELVTINFRSRAIRTDRALEVKVRDCLKAFDQTGTYDAALKLCRTACPGCEVGLAQALSDGRWIVEVRYDNLLHEGEGETAAAALADAVLQISKTIEAEQI